MHAFIDVWDEGKEVVMNSYCKIRGLKPVGWSLAMVLALLMGTLVAANTQAFTLNVEWVDQDGNSGPVAEYR